MSSKDFLHAVHDSKVYGITECLDEAQCHECGEKLDWKQATPDIWTYTAWCDPCGIAYHAFPHVVIVRTSDGL